MTPALLREAGEAMYGSRWQSDMARDLGVSDRTVRRWVAGEFAIPPNVWSEIAVRARARRLCLEKFAAGVAEAEA